MPCTTILVGKHASFDGSTMIARNDDSGSGHFMPKKFVVIHPEEQKRTYQSVISHVTVELPENPMRYTAMPNAIEGKGIWAACGVNEVNVAMTATETIANNPRVLGADPLVEYLPAGWKGRTGRRNRGRGYCLSGASLYSQCARGRGASWKPSRKIRNL